MSNLKNLPVKAELALSQAIRAVKDAGGDDLTIAALTQQLETELEHHGFTVRPGFRSVARGVLDLSGRDRFAELACRTNARLGEEAALAAGTTVAEAGGEFPIEEGPAEYRVVKVEGARFAVQNDLTGRFSAGTYATEDGAQGVADYLNGKR